LFQIGYVIQVSRFAIGRKASRPRQGANRTFENLPARCRGQTERSETFLHAAGGKPNVRKPSRPRQGANRTFENLPARCREQTERPETFLHAAGGKPNVRKPSQPRRLSASKA